MTVNGRRLLDRIDLLASIGADVSGGVSRLAFSAEDVAGRDLVATWMAEAGLTVEVDAATNLIGRRPGRRPDAPVIATGSHLDSVKGGGTLDGAYGVVAAIEAAAYCGPLDHPLAVVAFANEEGTVAPPGFTGSRAIAGMPVDLDQVVDAAGRTLGEVLAAAGGRPDALGGAAWTPGSVGGFVELHIEQGPVLERAAAGIGVVESITGRMLLDARIVGQAGHAGTTPMDARSDALVAAAHLVLAVQELAGSGLVRVATAGLIECTPNLHNVIPGQVSVGIDIRDAIDGRVVDCADQLEKAAAIIGAAQGVSISCTRGELLPAVPADRELVELLHSVAEQHVDKVLRLGSGAAHDAQIMAAIAPMAMLFVPSISGLSHTAAESTAPADLILGASVLAGVLAALDRRP